MKKLKTKLLSFVTVFFALVLCLGGGVACLSYNNGNTHSKVNSTQLGYTMPSVFTGNYVVSGGKVYAETTEDNQDSVADDDETNAATLTSTASSHGGLDTFGFSQNGTLNITFLKDDYTNNLSKVNFASFASARNTEVASTLSATYNNGTVEMVIADAQGETQIETSGDACYTLGELVTGTSKYLNVAGCVFSLGDSQTETANNVYTTANLTGTATLTATTTESTARVALVKSGNLRVTRNMTISGGSSYGRAFYVQPNATLELHSFDIESFRTSGDGGAIYNEGKLLIEGCSIEDCSATNGGAIYSTNNLEVANSTIYHNTATASGGGLYLTNGLVDIYDSSSIESNKAKDGAGIYAYNSKSNNVLLDITLYDSYVQYNQCTRYGGGLYINGKATRVNSDNSEIYYNTAAYGGGVYLTNKGNFAAEYADFEGNMLLDSEGEGAHIFAQKQSTVSIDEGCMDGSRVVSGTSSSYGEAIELRESTMTLGNVEFYDSSTMANVIRISENSTLTINDGGYRDATGTLIYATTNSTLNIRGGSFHDNHDVIRVDNYASLNVTGGEFFDNDGTEIYATHLATLVNISGAYFHDHYASASVLDIKATCNVNISDITVSGTRSNYEVLYFDSRDTDDNGNSVTPNTITLTDCTFTDNGDERTNTGLMYFSRYVGHVIFDNVTVNGATTTGESYRRVISFRNQKVTIKNSSFTDCQNLKNSEYMAGGALYFEYDQYDAIAEIYNTTFTNCSAYRGGAIATQVQTKLLLSGCTFDGNTARGDFGGAICLEDDNTLGYLYAVDTVFKNNTSANDGGAVALGTVRWVDEDEYTKIGYFVGCQFTNNTASANGGAIHLQPNCYLDLANSYDVRNYGFAIGTLTSSNVNTFTGNTAGRNGGAIFIEEGCGVKATSASVTSNSAQTGGAIYASGSTRYGCSIVLSDNVTFDSNTATTSSGGAIYAYITGVNIKDGTTIKNNTANLGGGIYSTIGSITISGGTITGNSAGQGGGIYTNADITMSGGTISSNTAQNSTVGGTYANMGGGILIIGATFTMNGGNIGDGNRHATPATESARSNYSSSAGGGIACGDGATLNLNGGVIGYNCSNYGGGIYSASTTDKVNIKGASIGYNGTKSGSGGGVYSYGRVTMTSGSVSYNNSATYGGGLMLKATANSLSSGTISYNKATNNGGGVRIDASATISGSTNIHHNNAANGGGISVAGTLTLSGGSVSTNTSSSNGGGIHSTGTLTISSGTIDSNKSTGYGGGGVYVDGGSISVSNVTVSNNTAQNGAGIMSQVSMTITGGSFTSNVATGDGGGVYFLNGGSITDATVDDNQAYWGAGVIVRKKAVDLLTGTNIYNNVAVKNSAGGGGIGGGLFVYDGGTANIKGAIIGDAKATSAATARLCSNYASDGGAGIEIWGDSTVNLSSGTIAYNYAASQGGGIRNLGTLNVTGGTIAQNTAVNHGGAIYSSSSGTVTINSGTFTNNNASTAYAVYSAGTLTINGGTFTNNASNQVNAVIYINNSSATIKGGTFNSAGISLDMNTDNIGFYTFTGNPDMTSSRCDIWLGKNSYLKAETSLSHNYKIEKGSITSIDDGDTRTCYIAYSTNSTYKNSALNNLTVTNIPTGRELYTTDSSNYVYIRHKRQYIDLNFRLNGQSWDNTDGEVTVDFKVGTYTNYGVRDYYQEKIYGTTYQIVGIHYNNHDLAVSYSSEVHTLGETYASIWVDCTSLYAIGFDVVYSDAGWDWPESPGRVYYEYLPKGYNGSVPSDPERPNYTFLGWYTDASGGTKVTSFVVNGNVTYYAHWRQIICKVTLDKQGGTGGLDAFWYKYGIDAFYSDDTCTTRIFTVDPPSRTGYTFGGYYTGTNGTGTKYTASNYILAGTDYEKVAGNITLYAKWTINNCKITFDFTGLTDYTKIDTIAVYNSSHSRVGTIATNATNSTGRVSYTWTDSTYYIYISTSYLYYDDGGYGGYEDYIKIGTSYGSNNIGTLYGGSASGGYVTLRINFDKASTSTWYFVQGQDEW